MAVTRVLFVGGTGVLSAACADEAVRGGLEVTILTRGRTALRHPAGVSQLRGDIEDGALAEVLARQKFDVVVDFIAFTERDVHRHIDAVRGRVDQYVFVSSASAYFRPIPQLPLRESCPLRNLWSEYSRNKIACEDVLVRAFRETGFPVTLVRPSHTYDRTSMPLDGRWTVVDRMRRNAPVIVHGDGTALWPMTHSSDFAQGFAPLLGNPRTIGESYHITTDEVLTWDQIYGAIGHAAGVEPNLVHVPSEVIVRAFPEWGPALLGEKAHSAIFDNTKVRGISVGWRARIPFGSGAKEMIAWRDEMSERREVDEKLNARIDRLITSVKSCFEELSS